MRLIDADKLRKNVIDLPNCYNGFSDTYDKAMILDLVDEQPTVDAKPTRHGRWKKSGNWGRVYKCDQCGNYLDFDGVNAGRGGANYCTNCGAKMDEETK